MSQRKDYLLLQLFEIFQTFDDDNTIHSSQIYELHLFIRVCSALDFDWKNRRNFESLTIFPKLMTHQHLSGISFEKFGMLLSF